ncbi:MAG: aminoacyl-tRNA hydrolase [Oscillospiraceae bacterium]
MGFFRKKQTPTVAAALLTGKVEYIVAGLGNPGLQYEKTRHNAGFFAADVLCAAHGARCDRARFKAMCGELMAAGKRVLVMKPMTYMNNSGEAIAEAMRYYRIPPERVIVLFDDISLEPGLLRVRRKGSDGGHNGIKSIVALAGSEDFPRVKIGVGKKPHPQMNLADWVLSSFTDDELTAVSGAAEKAAQAAELIIAGEADKAMNLYN